MKRFLTRALFYGTLILLPFSSMGCRTPPERLPGTPDPGVLQKEANEEFKVYMGKPDSYGQDETERYHHRGDGVLEEKFMGLKGTWKF